MYICSQKQESWVLYASTVQTFTIFIVEPKCRDTSHPPPPACDHLIGHVPAKMFTAIPLAASSAVGLSFLRSGGASLPAATRSRKTHVAHRKIKIERVYRPYLTATEAVQFLIYI
jgi:hypothetical protein